MTYLYLAMAAGLAVLIVTTLLLVSLTRRVRMLEDRAEASFQTHLVHTQVLEALTERA